MSQILKKTPKRIWALVIVNIAMILLALVVNLMWIYPQESDNTLSYFWTYKYPSFLFLTILITSVGILIGGNKWRIALAVLATLYFGQKVVEQSYLIFTRYDAMDELIFRSELIGGMIPFVVLCFNYWALFTRKSNQYFDSATINES